MAGGAIVREIIRGMVGRRCLVEIGRVALPAIRIGDGVVAVLVAILA